MNDLKNTNTCTSITYPFLHSSMFKHFSSYDHPFMQTMEMNRHQQYFNSYTKNFGYFHQNPTQYPTSFSFPLIHWELPSYFFTLSYLELVRHNLYSIFDNHQTWFQFVSYLISISSINLAVQEKFYFM